MCDWCGVERAHGKVLCRGFPSYQDVSWSLGWDCLAKFHSLHVQIGAVGPGHVIVKETKEPVVEEEEGDTHSEEDTDEDARKRAFGGVLEDSQRRAYSGGSSATIYFCD